MLFSLLSESQTFLEDDENYLQLDTIFMPVQKVDFKIENVYDTANNITERLFLDIWTNGSISPEEAIFQSSQLIINLFEQLLVFVSVLQKEVV